MFLVNLYDASSTTYRNLFITGYLHTQSPKLKTMPTYENYD